MENWCCARPAASSTSSASYPESPVAYMTFVNCAARGCGTAATSPLWSVRVNTQTHRAAPMEAPLPPGPPHPPLHPLPRPHQTPPPRLHWRARKALKPGTFSPSGNNPETEAMGSFAGLGSCWCSKGLDPSLGFLNCLLPPLSTAPASSFHLTEDFFHLRCKVVTLPSQNVTCKGQYHMNLLRGRLAAGCAGSQEAFLLEPNGQSPGALLVWSYFRFEVCYWLGIFPWALWAGGHIRV